MESVVIFYQVGVGLHRGAGILTHQPFPWALEGCSRTLFCRATSRLTCTLRESPHFQLRCILIAFRTAVGRNIFREMACSNRARSGWHGRRWEPDLLKWGCLFLPWTIHMDEMPKRLRYACEAVYSSLPPRQFIHSPHKDLQLHHRSTHDFRYWLSEAHPKGKA